MEMSKKRKGPLFYLRRVSFIIAIAAFGSVILFSLVEHILEKRNIIEADIAVGYFILQSIAGIVALFVPEQVAKRVKIDIPDFMFLWYNIFVICGIYLGNVWSFYEMIPAWDSILHVDCGILLTILGIMIANHIDKIANMKLKDNPEFIAFFAFCFAIVIGVLWEVFEYAGDAVLHTNMQRYMTFDGVPFVGRMALHDTMKDLIQDVLGALGTSIIYAIIMRKKLKKAQEQDAAVLE